eukprot:6711670-Alexandrium_andersonii.AAC.1
MLLTLKCAGARFTPRLAKDLPRSRSPGGSRAGLAVLPVAARNGLPAAWPNRLPSLVGAMRCT